MTIIQAILLGLLQGIAEFLPISSSGHLAVAEHLFGVTPPLLFDICLHLATLAATVLYFRATIAGLIASFARFVSRRPLQPEDSAHLQLIAALIAGTAVTAVLGILTSKLIPDLPVQTICVGFIITAGLLLLSGRLAAGRNGNRLTRNVSAAGSVSVKQGLVIGLLQGVGTLPGISRSGSTIAGALLSGVERKTAGEFSFLIAIPAVAGAFVLELSDFSTLTSEISGTALAAGCAVAFVAGLFSLTFLMKLIQKGKLEWFALYLIPVGVLGIIFL